MVVNRTINSDDASFERENISDSLASPIVVMAPVGDEGSNLSTLFQVAPVDDETAADDKVAGIHSSLFSTLLTNILYS